MNASDTLSRIRELATIVLGTASTHPAYHRAADELAELSTQLDEHLMCGGTPPSAWTDNRGEES